MAARILARRGRSNAAAWLVRWAALERTVNRARYKAAATVRNNAPTVFGVYDRTDTSDGNFNGRLVSEHETRESAETDANALNADARSREPFAPLPTSGRGRFRP